MNIPILKTGLFRGEPWNTCLIFSVVGEKMIEVMRLDGKKYWINPHMIETMEQNPDLTLTMLSGRKIVIKNTPEDIITKIIAYRRKIGVKAQEV